MGLREIESTLPPGFRFYPSDEELVCHYLYKKVTNERAQQGTLVEVDLHAREPWELPDAAKLTASEWYFFSFRDRKYATGSRSNRATKTGYWKATGKDREVRNPATGGRGVVGMRKTLVFYQGRAPNGVKSCWVMHEFRLDSPHTPPKEDWVLCRVFQKRKDSEQDNAGSSSPPFAAGASQPEDQRSMMIDAYVVDQPPPAGSSAGFAPPPAPQENQLNLVGGGLDALLMNGAMWQYASSSSSVFDHFTHPQQQEVTSSSPMTMMTGLAGGSRGGGGGGGGDGGCSSFFYDSGFEDMANIGGMGLFPQGWMG